MGKIEDYIKENNVPIEYKLSFDTKDQLRESLRILKLECEYKNNNSENKTVVKHYEQLICLINKILKCDNPVKKQINELKIGVPTNYDLDTEIGLEGLLKWLNLKIADELLDVDLKSKYESIMRTIKNQLKK